MDKDDYTGTRKSFMEMGEIFFWTATINGWQHLLKEEQFKAVIIQSTEGGSWGHKQSCRKEEKKNNQTTWSTIISMRVDCRNRLFSVAQICALAAIWITASESKEIFFKDRLII